MQTIMPRIKICERVGTYADTVDMSQWRRKHELRWIGPKCLVSAGAADRAATANPASGHGRLITFACVASV